jgi:hypothetical protein
MQTEENENHLDKNSSGINSITSELEGKESSVDTSLPKVEKILETVKLPEEDSDLSGEPSYARSMANVNAEDNNSNYRQAQLSNREINSLKRKNYLESSKKFNQSFVVLNKKTGMLVEMRAATSYHACTMIGWRPKNCRILKIINHDNDALDPSTSVVSNNNDVSSANSSTIVTFE